MGDYLNHSTKTKQTFVMVDLLNMIANTASSNPRLPPPDATKFKKKKKQEISATNIYILGGFKIRVTNTNEFAQREAFNPGLPVEPGPHCSPSALLCLH